MLFKKKTCYCLGSPFLHLFLILNWQKQPKNLLAGVLSAQKNSPEGPIATPLSAFVCTLQRHLNITRRITHSFDAKSLNIAFVPSVCIQRKTIRNFLVSNLASTTVITAKLPNSCRLNSKRRSSTSAGIFVILNIVLIFSYHYLDAI